MNLSVPDRSLDRLRNRWQEWLPLAKRRLAMQRWKASAGIRRAFWRTRNAFAAVQVLGLPAIGVLTGVVVDAFLPAKLAPKIIGDLLVGSATLVGGFLTA